MSFENLSDSQQDVSWTAAIAEPIHQELEENFGLEHDEHEGLLLPVSSRAHKSASSSPTKWRQIAVWALALVAFTAIAFMLCREYLGSILVWLESLPTWLGIFIFIMCYIIVSFPFMMGVVVLNLAAGYLYGMLDGTLICLFGSAIGALIATQACKTCCRSSVAQLQHEYANLKQLARVLEGNQGFRIIAMARLTFVPFGLQNALFASAKISRRGYMVATALGMTPMILLNTYMGRSVRSMEQLMQGDWAENSHYTVVVTGQLIIAALVTWYVSQRMKKEILNACRDGMQSQSGRTKLHPLEGLNIQDKMCGASELDVIELEAAAAKPLPPVSQQVRKHRRTQSAGPALSHILSGDDLKHV